MCWVLGGIIGRVLFWIVNLLCINWDNNVNGLSSVLINLQSVFIPPIVNVYGILLFLSLFIPVPVVDCGDPGTPENAQRTLSSTTYNSVVSYRCDIGYTISAFTRTCQSDGQWSGSLPQCTSEPLTSACFSLMHVYGIVYHSILAFCEELSLTLCSFVTVNAYHELSLRFT